MQDQGSYILVPLGDDATDPLVYRASNPARLPPAINIDEVTDADPLPPLPFRPSTCDRSLHDKIAEEDMSKNPKDVVDPLPVDRPLYNHDSIDDRSRRALLIQLLLMTIVEAKTTWAMTIPNAHASLSADCPFTFLYLSSEDSTRGNPSHDAEQDNSLPDASSTGQGTSHMPVIADEVLSSIGDVRST